MKCIYKPIILDLMRNAAANGSSIAKLIVRELEEDIEIQSKKQINYFDAYYSMENDNNFIQLTACCKDINNPFFPDKDPNAMWKPEHRSAISLTVFISRFESVREAIHRQKTIPETDIQYLRDILGMKPVHIEEWSGAKAIEYAYNGKNYISFGTDRSLANSCMRYDTQSKYCGIFYGDIMKTKILVAIDEDKKIYGRAIIWPEVYFSRYRKSRTLLDRCYYCDRGVLTLMYQYAQEHNFIRKKLNDFCSKDQFCLYTQKEGWVPFTNKAYTIVNVDQESLNKFKGKIPYLDTMSWLHYDINTHDLTLRNTEYADDTIKLLQCTSTSASGEITGSICPICGTYSSRPNHICCETDSLKYVCGILVSMDNIEVDGVLYPKSFLNEDKTLNKYILNNYFINKIGR